ncbi:extracellular matrix glycoprotein pherophorin-V21 [Volvox carteri f. nagariensis]|uniref:Extracellular matrix glycoprotein pherophorin-V21 n=1 Tax=Volvox carteri f. nagariensis TaxID=3068 RepID=D8TUC9_VOLCA|nr:extracellular matrix glycoprotein pherophorin-V21 [Volvox carteri f. nagariensis]EFJ49122.1 extracellular matrix glycoprotein pherophorin-V21 [Volvox carteri f. nagariensis]|eukprot:XP_002950019.1 extracellular matrix glycoprotein pherophorin-V21 [Volvox carteri f. nagariensis]
MAPPLLLVASALALAWACGATAQVAPVELAYTQTGAVPYFPFFLCARAQASFSLAPVVTNVGGGQYCFTLLAVPCNKTCCNVPLKKIEFNVYSSCLVPGASVSATVNGVPTAVSPSFDRPQDGPPGSSILRVTQLGLNLTSNGAKICITLKPNSAGQGCTTLEQLPPSPSPPISSCDMCIDLTIDPARVFPPYQFDSFTCEIVQTSISYDINEKAASMGLMLAQNFSVDASKCSSDKISVCGKFASESDAAQLEEWTRIQAEQFWVYSFASACTPVMYGYSFRITTDKCMDVEKSRTCSLVQSDFPFCGCQRKRYSTPFYVSPSASSEQGRTNDTTLYCFTLGVLPNDFALLPGRCNSSSKVAKVEIWANEDRRGKLRGFRLSTPDGKTRWLSPSWGDKGSNTAKVSGLTWNRATANGAEVCMELKNDISLQEFCVSNVCSISLFDGHSSKACCPTYQSVVA